MGPMPLRIAEFGLRIEKTFHEIRRRVSHQGTGPMKGLGEPRRLEPPPLARMLRGIPCNRRKVSMPPGVGKGSEAIH